MKTNYLKLAHASALALLVGLTACSGIAAGGAGPAPAAPGAPAAASSQGLWQQIQAEIGTAACDSSSQCRTMPVGHKSCGGPESYAAYSVKAGDQPRLAQLGKQYSAARKAENQRGGMVSNCMLERDPGATCVANRCMLQKNGPGAVAQ